MFRTGQSLQIADSIDTLLSVQCATTTCESYKTTLLERSIDSYEHLSKVLNEWAPTLDRLGLIGGAAAGKQGGSRPAGVPEREGLAQVQKAVEYLGSAKAKSALLDNIASNIHAGQQGKHVLRHNNFIPGRCGSSKTVKWCSCRRVSYRRLCSRGQPIVKPAEYHSDPHTHTYEYGPGYGPKGKETRINND